MSKLAVLRARVEVDLKARYDAEAARTGLDVSSLVRLALIRFLPTDDSRVGISVGRPAPPPQMGRTIQDIAFIKP